MPGLQCTCRRPGKRSATRQLWLSLVGRVSNAPPGNGKSRRLPRH
nr:MAG TPA: hypothetical protein [Caudoviricetes sp.]